MDEMTYELILRKAYGSGRHGGDGDADADIYRRFSKAVNTLMLQKKALEDGKMPLSTLSIDDLEYEVRTKAATVGMNLNRGIRHVLETKYPSADQKEKLEKLMDSFYPQYDEKEMGRLMAETMGVFKEMGLKTG